jgi:lipopolysaccharide transport system ATP-binding protein
LDDRFSNRLLQVARSALQFIFASALTMRTVIHAEGLSKLYRRGLQTDAGLRHILEEFVRSPRSVFRQKKNETFWALKDVSLEVKEGEVLGLIGRNGAGKTTLLKILSRITRPTAGWAEIRGRVGSLLEVGTGFHPELTGRENTFLSGAILGMGRAEIARKFDEIVAFAELEKFIETPVKHYSSGMYVRLAFAVAAHLEPEILLVDEVLAVGDINFQKKCLGKVGDVAREGRTIVLVSHQLNQIRRLAHRVVWIDDGSVRQDGDTHQVVSGYESAMSAGERMSPKRNAAPLAKARFVRWEVFDHLATSAHYLDTPGPVKIVFHVDVRRPIRHVTHGVALYNSDRQLIWGTSVDNLELRPGAYQLAYEFPILPLRPGPYSWLLSLWDDEGQVDLWDGIPDMIVAMESCQHPRDEWSGVLNLVAEFTLDDSMNAPDSIDATSGISE